MCDWYALVSWQNTLYQVPFLWGFVIGSLLVACCPSPKAMLVLEEACSGGYLVAAVTTIGKQIFLRQSRWHISEFIF